jgi:hypothetical protein
MWKSGGEMPTGFWWKNLSERENLEDPDFRWKNNINIYP